MSAKRKNARALNYIREADLPKELAALITTTISKTKLWKSERAEIAQELITHTQDALQSGRSSTQIIESFGDPKKVAKLLRRAAKRKRPLYWRAMRNIRRGIGAVFALIFVVYSVQLVRYLTGHPNVKTNYAQIINAPNDAYTEEQKAWPVYNQINIAWKALSNPVRELQYEEERIYNQQVVNQSDLDMEYMSAGFFMIPHVPTDHPHYEQTAQLVRDFSTELDWLREACHRPIIGIDLGFDMEIMDPDDDPYDTRMVPPDPNPNLQPTLVELQLPHLGSLRQFANLLYFDTLIAARDSDHERVYENLSAMLAMSRQQSFDGTIIADLVNIAIASVSTKAILQIINQYPGALSRDHLVALSHELSLVEPALWMSFEGERMMFDDVLQRTYTDDGNGNGRLTKHGAQILHAFSDMHWDRDKQGMNPIQILTGPVALTIAEDRKTQHDTYHEMMDLVEDVQRKGPQYFALLSDQEKQFTNESRIVPGLIYAPVDLLLPALSSAVNRVFLSHQNFNAAGLMLSLEIYRIDHGNYPESLDPLYPNYIPRLPEDAFNPGHTLGYITTDSGYTLYSVGSDGDDDLAKEPQNSLYSPTFSQRFPPKYNAEGQLMVDETGKPIPGSPKGEDGDWILFAVDRSENN